LTVDRTGRLYVADLNNARVLRFSPPFNNGQEADLVLGQADFTTGDQHCNAGQATANVFCNGEDVAVDGAGGVYVSDGGFHRVLRFSPPLSNGQAADMMLGQPDFTSVSCNTSGLSARTLCQPFLMAIDAQDALWVADLQNSRVIRFSSPRSLGQAADLVLGEPNLNMASALCPAADVPVNASLLCAPIGVAVDRVGQVFVTDNNRRAVRFSPPLSNGKPADLVFGVPNFASSGCVAPTSTATLCGAFGVTVDFRGDLFVVENSASRVVRYDEPTNGTQAPGGTAP
jgi:hypothetical protein